MSTNVEQTEPRVKSRVEGREWRRDESRRLGNRDAMGMTTMASEREVTEPALGEERAGRKALRLYDVLDREAERLRGKRRKFDARDREDTKGSRERCGKRGTDDTNVKEKGRGRLPVERKGALFARSCAFASLFLSS